MRRTRRNAPRPSIPVFALYGERDAPAEPEFVHIEDIRSRSETYGWEISSHTHRGLYQILVVLDGAGEAEIDGTASEVIGPAAITIAPAVVHSFRFRPGTRGYVLTLAEALLFASESHGPRSGHHFGGLFRHSGVIDLSVDHVTARRLEAMLDQLADEFVWPQPGRTSMLEWLVRTALLLLARRLTAASEQERVGGTRDGLFTQFRILLEQHYRDHWSVPRYATALHVTEARLNRTCRALAQKSAFDLIQERLALEARRRLIYVNAPVALLAYDLGFQDPAYFCRFFKRMTGSTPSEFRRSAPVGDATAEHKVV